jgi:hypothetical protein
MGKLTFRTIFGGPGMPQGYRTQLDQIERRLKTCEFPYDLDLTLTIAGDMITVTHPTGLRTPRVKADQKRVTGSIFISSTDVKQQAHPEQFLSKVIHEAVIEILDRMAKTLDFDKDSERQKVQFLLDVDGRGS